LYTVTEKLVRSEDLLRAVEKVLHGRSAALQLNPIDLLGKRCVAPGNQLLQDILLDVGAIEPEVKRHSVTVTLDAEHPYEAWVVVTDALERWEGTGRNPVVNAA
jgi:hypothetical protein